MPNENLWLDFMTESGLALIYYFKKLWGREVVLHRGSVLASHPAARGSITCISEILF